MVIVSAMTIHEWLLVFLCLKSCSCLDWSCSSSHCTARGSHSLTWKDAFSSCRKENGFLAFPTEEILENPEPLWTPLVRLPGKFFFQWLLKIPKLQRLEETELVTADTYNDSERCFVTNPRDGKLKSQHCFTKSSFVCERSVGAENMTVLPRKNITVTLSVDTTDSRKLNGGSFQYVGYNRNFSDRTVPSFHCKVQYKENNMKLKPKNIVTNLLFNGYYVGRPSPWILKNIESKTKLDSIGDLYQIMTSSNYNPYNYFAEGGYQCAAWLPGEDQPVKSNTVALASSQAVYAILNRTIKVPDAADYVRNARLTGKPDGMSRGCLHLEGGDCKEAWKLYGIEVKPGSNNSAVIMSYHIKTWTFSFKYPNQKQRRYAAGGVPEQTES